MKIGTVDVKVSLPAIAVFLIFGVLLIAASAGSPAVRSELIWLVPGLFLLLLIPIALSYMSRRQYAELEPAYEREATTVRVRVIDENMIGKIVQITGVIRRVHGRFLNRPQFIVADRSAAILVKMFTSPGEDIRVDDAVEVLGQVIRRYVVTGEPVINCVVIRKISGRSR